ncbi:redoxin domain-containing protein [Salegentibacter sp. BLCTC]|uniref:TlpA disulfide reductase family protein n=1 Tax=Salegentibacter sp. BLCTC TaxID=2697368 RepID=UPI00187B22F4|nr:TlpA disulfide reductase family protein [Salegentibacter sp. BLCTC]MBE7639352.1 redoxin domain-containing protein [Salegentibacter sp. BLCTC]
MMRYLLIIICLCSLDLNTQQHKFTLTGKTSNIEDGTYLYLKDLVTGKSIDSAKVQNNSFKMNTELEKSMVYSMLFTKDRKNFIELWIEGNEMTLDASNTIFNNAIVKGSKSQDLSKKIRSEVHANIVDLPNDTIKNREINFIKKYPNSLVSAYFLYGNRRMTQQEIKELFTTLSNDVRNSSLGQKIANFLEKDMPEVGEKYTDFQIANENDELQKISELTGKITLIQFWSSTCGGSREMNTTLKKVYDQYHSKGLNIISISKDNSKANWINAINEDNLSWSQLSNLEGWNGEVFKAYGISSTPSNVLIDENGIIISKNLMINELGNKISQSLN